MKDENETQAPEGWEFICNDELEGYQSILKILMGLLTSEFKCK